MTRLHDMPRAARGPYRAREGISHALPRILGLAVLVLVPAMALADVRLPRTPHVEIRGTGAMLHVARQVAERYMAEHPDAVVTVAGGGAYRGLKSVLLGTADLALATDTVPDEIEKLAHDQNQKVVGNPVYTDAVVPIVHPKNPVSDLWMNQLKDIFRGAVVNWNEIGGKDAPIEVITFDPTEGAYETFKREVLGDDAVMTPKATQVAPKDFEKAITENAIGYASLHVARGLKRLRVNGVEATPETVKTGAYFIRRHLSIYHREAMEPETAKVVEYFLTPDKGQSIVRAWGGVPVK